MSVVWSEIGIVQVGGPLRRGTGYKVEMKKENMSLANYIIEKVPFLQICTLCPGPGEANREVQEMEEERAKCSPTPALGPEINDNACELQRPWLPTPIFRA